MGKQTPVPSQTSQTTQVQYPDWVNSAAQGNLAQASGVSANLAKPYGGQMVADMTPGQQTSIAGLSALPGVSAPAYNSAMGTAQGVSGYNPQQVGNQDVAGGINSFMTPYTQNVINPTMQLMEQQRQGALNQIGDQANAAHAFGGSRQGVAEGVTNAQYGAQEGQMAGNLYNQGYTQALGGAQQQAGLNQQGALANQQAGLSGAGINLQGANSLGNLATGNQQALTSGYQNANAAQTQLQQQNQAQINAQMQYYNAMAQYPLNQLQVNMSALGQTPYGNTSSSTGTSTPSYMPANPFMGALGAVGTIASLIP